MEGEGWEYELEASFVEVYNESLRDLLAEGRGRDVGKLPDANVIKHHPTGLCSDSQSPVNHAQLACFLPRFPAAHQNFSV